MSDRKYRQRGYQDDATRRERRPQAPKERKEGPRGRGLGAPTETVFRCADCGERIPVTDGVAFDATCPRCQGDLHTCTNCRHFDTSAPNECRQPVEVRIRKKRARNECTLFEPKLTQEFASDRRDREDPHSAFDALFDS